MATAITSAARMPPPNKAAPQNLVGIRNTSDAGPNPATNKTIGKNDGGEPQYFVNRNLTVEKSIVNELLLVCGVIGSTVDPDTQQMIPVEDCLNWLQDLQRALRRDDDAHRPISLLLGKWKVLQQKLLPLVLSCRYDTPLVLTIVKILVILTKPLSENAKKAGRFIIDIKKTDETVIREQIKLRNNAIAQANLLKDYKRLFVHHPSHRRENVSSSKNRRGHIGADDADDKGLLSIFVSLLVEPLSRTGSARTDDDHLTIELILHLFRNLLSAGDPILKGTNALDKVHVSAVLHQELICLFDREMVLDIILVIGQEMESRENKQYNLLMMEILHHMLKSQDPTLVARSVQAKNHKVTNQTTMASNRSAPNKISSSPQFSKRVGMNSLRAQLQKERQKLQVASTSRHSHFGGTLVIPKSGGTQRVLTAAATQGMASTPSSHGIIPLTSRSSRNFEAKRKTKKHQHFVGAGRTLAAHTRPGAANASATHDAGPSSQQAQRVLHSFCQKIMSQCYGPIMKSLKNEFRRDSNRLEDQDKVIFFRIIWFFCQWARVSASEGGIKSLSSEDSSRSVVGHLVFTMDVFTFNLVLAATDYYFEHKKYAHLAQTVALYSEMVSLLHTMYSSADDTEKIMAMGLMDRLFYQTEPIDRLPKLLSRWAPGTYTREYICDLVEISYMTLKLLEANAKACLDLDKEDSKKARRKKRDEPMDAVARMKDFAASFDTTNYFSRKIVSNQVVLMFTQLFSLYDVNATHINDHIVSFFVRICKFVVVDEREEAEYFATSFGKNKPGAIKVTLEPMLYNIPFLTVLNNILNDVSLRDETDFYSVLSFATTIVRHYAKACSKNPMLHVETLFRHALPHRFCEMSANLYVSEELQMMTERDILLEQQEQLELGDEDDVKSATEVEDEDHKEEAVGKTKQISDIVQQKEDSESDIDGNPGGSEHLIEKNLMKEADDITHHSGSSRTESKILKEGEESNLPESTPSYSTSVVEGAEDDAVQDERWNDRRKFVPKRKSMSQETGEEYITDEPKEATNRLKRIRRAVLVDSDEEEDEDFGISEISPGRFEATNSSRLVFDDDEDD